MNDTDETRGHKAVATLYHAFITGFILTVTTRAGTRHAEDFWFAVFRRQHLDLFLPGLKKLGLEGLPDAVAAAQYHYLSNRVAGVKVEYMYESDTKAWVRFVPPRWVYDGAAICGVPGSVSRALLRGWYGHNGVALGNPRLGFVCTAQTMDGQHGLAGYFREYGHDLSADERLVFSPGEQPPPFDAAAAPEFDADAWPQERLGKANRNYSMNFTRALLSQSAALFGPAEAAYYGGVTGQLIGMQFYDETRALLGIAGDDAAAFAQYLAAMARAHDDRVEIETVGNAVHVRQYGWRVMRGVRDIPECAFDAWNGLWRGALTAHNRFLVLEVLQRLDYGDECIEWRIRRRAASSTDPSS
jgi:hypothetical protein